MQGIEKKYLLATLALLIFLFVAGFTSAEKNVVLSVDGKTSKVKTNAEDVIGLLRQQKVAHKDQDLVVPPPLSSVEEGSHVIVKHATPIIVELNGKKSNLFTLASTVRGTVAEAGIGLSNADKIAPGPETKITKNLPIKITKANSNLDANRVPIPYRTVTQEDGSLLQGRAVVVQEGKEGASVQIFNVKCVDGQEVERKLRTERVVCAPVDEVVRVGTKVVVHQERRAKSVRVASSGAYHEAAPSSYSGGGRSVTMKGTAYSPGPQSGGYGTASGRKAQYGVVAVDPRVIPLGTKLYIEGYGDAVAGDTGGAIKGNRIDLCYESESQCNAFGRRDVVVHIK